MTSVCLCVPLVQTNIVGPRLGPVHWQPVGQSAVA